MKKIITLILLFMTFTGNMYFSEEVSLSGNNYVLMEEVSGRILLEDDAHIEMPMASTTKVMTALLAIELGDLDEYVEIDEECIDIIGSSIYLELGEEVKLEDLIYGLMLRSGNDASVAIAKHISGSVEDFVDQMNEKAKEIGANNTNFMNPHGLHDDDHYSTPYDMALITREALKSEKFSEIWGSKSFTSDREKNDHFVNKNKTLWDYEGGDGGKTGYTSDSGRCLVSTASRDNMRLIAVCFNASDWFNDNYKLFDYGFDTYQIYSLYSKGQLLERVNVENGSKDEVVLVSEENLLYPLSDEELDQIKINIDIHRDTSLPINEGDKFGFVKTYLNGKIIRSDNLVAKYNIMKKSLIEKIIDKVENSI